MMQSQGLFQTCICIKEAIKMTILLTTKTKRKMDWILLNKVLLAEVTVIFLNRKMRRQVSTHRMEQSANFDIKIKKINSISIVDTSASAPVPQPI